MWILLFVVYGSLGCCVCHFGGTFHVLSAAAHEKLAHFVYSAKKNQQPNHQMPICPT